MGASPLLLFPLLEELTPVPDATLPTLLESSMLPRGRLMLMLMPSMVPMVWATLDTAMLDLATAMPVLATLLLPLPLPLSLLLEESTLVPDVTLPTLLELSMLPRGRLRLMPSTVLMVLDMLVLATLDWATVMPVLATLPLLLLLWLLLLLLPLSLPATPTSPPATPTSPPPPPSPPLEL